MNSTSEETTTSVPSTVVTITTPQTAATTSVSTATTTEPTTTTGSSVVITKKFVVTPVAESKVALEENVTEEAETKGGAGATSSEAEVQSQPPPVQQSKESEDEKPATEEKPALAPTLASHTPGTAPLVKQPSLEGAAVAAEPEALDPGLPATTAAAEAKTADLLPGQQPAPQQQQTPAGAAATTDLQQRSQQPVVAPPAQQPKTAGSEVQQPVAQPAQAQQHKLSVSDAQQQPAISVAQPSQSQQQKLSVPDAQQTGTQQQQKLTSHDAQQPATQPQSQKAASSQPQRTPGVKSEASIESVPSGYTSQENTVPRPKQKGQEHMDFENLKQKLDQLSGKQKPVADGKSLSSLPSTPCNQIGIDPGQPTAGTVQSVGTSQQQSQSAQPVSAPLGSSGAAVALPPQSNVPAHPSHAQVPTQNVLSHPGAPAAGVVQPQLHAPHHPGSAQHPGVPSVQGTFAHLPQQQHPPSVLGTTATDQHHAANYNTWHGVQNPLFQAQVHPQALQHFQQPTQSMSHALQYLQQQHHFQQQQQQLQQLQHLLQQQQQIQQHLAAQGIYVPMNQISLPHPSSTTDQQQSLFSIRRQMETAGLDQFPMHQADSSPTMHPSSLVSPPQLPGAASGLVRPATLPILGIDPYGALHKARRERPADIHNLEQALIEKLHRHKPTGHLSGGPPLGYMPVTSHDVASFLGSPSIPAHLGHGASAHTDHGQLAHGVPVHTDHAHQVLNAMEMNPDALHTAVTHEPVTLPASTVTVSSQAEVPKAAKEETETTKAAEVEQESSGSKAPTTAESPVRTNERNVEGKKVAKSRFSVTIVKNDPLKLSGDTDSEKTGDDKAQKLGVDLSAEGASSPLKVLRQVSKRGRFQVTTVHDPSDEPVLPLVGRESVERKEVSAPPIPDQRQAADAEVKEEETMEEQLKQTPTTTSSSSLSDRVSSMTSGSDYQATVDSVPSSGENSAENTAGSDVASGLSVAATTLVQQAHHDSVAAVESTAAPRVSAVDPVPKPVTTVGLPVGAGAGVVTPRDVYTAMAVSTSQMAGLGAVHPHQSVHSPLVAHMVADSAPHQHAHLADLYAPGGAAGHHQFPQSCAAGVSGLSQILSPQHQTVLTGVAPLPPSVTPAAAAAAPAGAGVSMHGWSKASLPAVVELSSCEHSPLCDEDEHASVARFSPKALQPSSNASVQSRHNSLPCLSHANGKSSISAGASVVSSTRSPIRTGSSRSSHGSLSNAPLLETRRQSAPVVNVQSLSKTMLKSSEHASRDFSGSMSGPGPTAAHVYARNSPTGSSASDEVSQVSR